MHYKALIDGYRIWDDVSKITSVLENIRENKSKIETIELSTNSLSFDAAKALSEEIKNIENLKHVNYRDIFVSRKKTDLPASLKELMLAIEDKKIEILDLSDNAFGPIGVKSFDFFISKTFTLRELYLENNGLGPEGAESLAETLLCNENIKLQTLVINRNRLENKGAIAFSKVLEKMQSLVKLQFFQNGINADGFTELFKSLKFNRNLRHIKINDNTIKTAVKYLIEALEDLKHIEELDVSDSLIGSKNSVKLFEALKCNCENIREIYSNYNEIEDVEQQESIFEIIKQMKNLKILEIKGNEIDKDLYKQIKNSLPNNLENFEAYSEDELEFEEEEKVEKELAKLKIEN